MFILSRFISILFHIIIINYLYYNGHSFSKLSTIQLKQAYSKSNLNYNNINKKYSFTYKFDFILPLV